MSAAPETIDLQSQHNLTRHAWKRMYARGFSPDIVDMVLCYGRVAHVRGATIHAIGRKEVEHYQREGVDLSPAEGVQVVCSYDDAILTVYRNRSLRGLHPRSHRTHRRTA
jgi:hypothetical protein